MNSRSTLALVLLAAIAGVWLWKGDELGPKIGLKPRVTDLPPSESASILDSLTPGTLTRVEVVYPSGDPLILERSGSESTWKLPGNWPPRKPELEELVEMLGQLRSRFQAIPVPEAADFNSYGVATDQKPLIVKLTASGQSITLTFGNPSPSGGETVFTRPAFVRVNDLPEVLQLGPDVMPVIGRPADSYRRRQLFTDVERVKIAAANSVPNPLNPSLGIEPPVTITLPGEETSSIEISRPDVRLFGLPLPQLNGNFTLSRDGKLPEVGVTTKGSEPTLSLERIADVWAFRAPHRDHVEPTRLRSLLSAVADLWAEEFVTPGSDVRTAIARHFVLPLPFESFATVARAAPIPFDVRTGLADSKFAITVKQSRGDSVTIRFGEVAKTREQVETITLPGGPPGTPPQTFPRKTVVEYRFAKLDGNPLVFVVPADNFPSLFVSVAQLTDPRVARFAPEEVQEVVVKHMSNPEVKLVRKKGNPKATNPAEMVDRWFLDAKPNQLLADSARVQELLDQISGFRSEKTEDITYPTTVPTPETQITVVAREKRAEGEADAPPRTYHLQIAKPDPIKRLLPIHMTGWPRVTLVSDKLGPDDLNSWIGSRLFPKTLSGLLARPPLAYRGRKLFDTADTSLTSLTVVASSGGFALSKDPAGDWKLTAPINSEADPGKAAQLASTLSALESTEYVRDEPTPDDLKEFGLDKPAEVVTLAFTNGQTYKLELGNPRPGKPEVFARLDGGGVFGLPATVVEQLTSGVVGLLPLRVWAALPDKVTALEISRMGDAAKDSFALAKDGTDWKLTGPFLAIVTATNAKPLLTTLGALQAVKYQTLTVAKAADFGLDKPFLRLRVSFLEKKPAPAGSPAKDDEQSVTKTLIVGGLTPDGGNRYAMLDAPNAPVFVVPAAYLLAAQTPPLDLLDRALLALDANQIAKVRVAAEKPEDAFSLTKDDQGKWSAEGITFAVDAERISGLIRLIAGLPVSRLAAYGDATKWADFGLEKPGTTLTITLRGDKAATHTIALGNVDPTGAQFIRVDDGKAVGVIPAVASEALTRKKLDYADRTLLTFDPAALVGLIRKQSKDELELLPATTVGWELVKPVKSKADQPFVDELVDFLSRLRAEKVAAYGKKEDVFKRFGLEPPATLLTLTIGEKSEQKTLRLGNPVDPGKPEGDRYAALDTTNPEAIVGILPESLTNKLLSPSVGFRDHTLAKFLDADKAILDRGNRKLTFTKQGTTWKITEPLMAVAESGELETLIADLGKLRVDTWVAPKTGDLKSFGLDKPEAKWQLFDGDKPVLTLLLGKKGGDGRVYVTTDKSELVGLLDPLLTSRVLAEYRQRRPWDVDAAQIEVVEIGKGSTKFELQKAGAIWFDPNKPTDPVDGRVVSELVGTLGALRVDRYAADKDADLKLYGLESPEARLTVVAPGVPKRVLEIGATVGGTEGKQRYARVVDKERSDVFVLTAEDTLRLMRDRSAYSLKK
jgi:hypothetical protein